MLLLGTLGREDSDSKCVGMAGRGGIITAGTSVSFASPRGHGNEDYDPGSCGPSFLHLHFLLLPPPTAPK